MAIYISKDAIQNIPIDPEDGNKEQGKLFSNLLKNDIYLSALANNPNSTAALKKGVEHESVKRITIAFQMLRQIDLDAPVFTNLNPYSTSFNDTVENNVKLFQAWIGLPESGIVDATTLIALDQELLRPIVTNLYNQTSYGVYTNIETTYFDDYNETTGEYKITLDILEIDHPITVTLNDAPRGSFIINNIDNQIRARLSTDTDIEIGGTDVSIEDKHKFGFLKGQGGLGIQNPDDSKIVVRARNLEWKVVNDINDYIENTPKSEFEDMGETYEVSAGESFSDIVLAKYYNTGPESILDPEDGSVVFTFPNRTPFPLANREDDARFQFYLNFLYYSNTEEIDGDVESWGMKIANGYSRYLIDELEEYNIFNNNYNPADANTALPNYYRFIKHMESVTPTSRLDFDGVGNCLNFEPQAGKNIIIPKRQFVDTIYNLLNYRHGEMLTAVGSSMIQVQGTALSAVISTLQTALNTLTTVAQIVKDEAIAVYNEAADFFITGLDFLINFLKKYWPRGSGGRAGLDVEITWGIPFATNFNVEKSIWRKMSSDDEVILCVSEKGVIKLGADFTAGFGMGLFSGVGKKKKTLGVNLGAGVENLIAADLEATYEFPLRPDETMLIAGLIAFLGPSTTTLTANVLKFFNIMNLEPRQYIAKTEIKLSNNFNAWGRADLGLSDENDGDGNLRIEPAHTETEMEANRSYGYLDNILTLLPGLGGMGVYSNISGVSFTAEYEYEDRPKIPELDARIFSKCIVEAKLFTSNSLSTGLIGSFLQRLFLSTATPVNDFFNEINFDRGVMLIHHVEMTRNGEAADVSLSSIKVDPAYTTITNLPAEGSLQYNNPDTIINTKAQLHFGMFSGDIEDLAAEGTESRLKLSLPEIRQIFDQGLSYQLTFANVKNLLIGFEYRKKVGLFKKDSSYVKGKARRVKHSAHEKYTDKTVEIFKTSNGTDTESEMLVQLFEKMSQGLQYLDTAMALGIKMDVPFSSLLSILEFYLKKLYHKYSNITNEPERDDFEEELEKARSKIESQVKDRQKVENNDSRKTFYDYLFAEENSYSSGGGTVTFKGLNGYIDDLLAENDPPTDFLDALGRFMQNPPSYNDFMQEITPITEYDIKDIGIHDFIDYFTLLTDILGLEINIEGLLGVSGGGYLKAGEGVLTAKIGLGGFAQLIYEADLYKDGQLTDLGINDPLRIIFSQLDALLAKASAGKKIPVRTLFDIIKD